MRARSACDVRRPSRSGSRVSGWPWAVAHALQLAHVRECDVVYVQSSVRLECSPASSQKECVHIFLRERLGAVLKPGHPNDSDHDVLYSEYALALNLKLYVIL